MSNDSEGIINDKENITSSNVLFSTDTTNILPQDMDNKPCGCNNDEGKNNLQKITMENPFIYAIGKIQPRFPSIGLQNEYNQAVGRSDTAGQTDYEAMRTALSKRENRYIARQICWIFTIEGLEAYILKPRDPNDVEVLLDALRVPPRGTDVDIIVGTRGPIATPDMCGGSMLPIVFFDKIYSFDIDSLIKSIPKQKGTNADKFNVTAEELFNRITQLADNTGSTDEFRALNYISVRYDAIYALTVEMHERNFSLNAVEVHPSRLRGVRKIVDVIFIYRNRNTDVEEKYFVRVDVTEEFPFLVTKLSPFFNR
jgi:hypothetical protein